ncbi:Hypothetical protein A7982_10501 [Minicystis rosea]|nr:Hypothetical protein A7982_10501 [Minicystis rosea]
MTREVCDERHAAPGQFGWNRPRVAAHHEHVKHARPTWPAAPLGGPSVASFGLENRTNHVDKGDPNIESW